MMVADQTLTGYPSIDKPWLKYYDEAALRHQEFARKRTVWQEVHGNNTDFEQGAALEFFGVRISFKELFDNVERCAAALVASGIAKGDVVTIICAGIPEFVYLFYAISKIGAIANLMAPYFDSADMAARINDCKSRMVFVMDGFYAQVEPVLEKTCVQEAVVIPLLASSPLRFIPRRGKRFRSEATKWKEFLRRGSCNGPVSDIPYEKDLPFVIVYSSGSTGASKGILLSQDSFQNSIHAYAGVGIKVSRGKKLYQIIPPWFSTGVSTSIHLPLSFGATVFMDPRFDRKVFVNNVLRARPNYTVGPTTVYEGFISESIPANADLSFLEAPFEGGEALLPSVADAINGVLAQHGCPVGLLTGYGQCECGATVTTMIQGATHAAGSVGVPLPGVNVAIMDDGFHEQEAGKRGRIMVDTPCGMLRYFKMPAETCEFFREDPSGKRWGCTGDIGYMDADGNLFVEGRISDVVTVDGEEYFCFDIENAFMELKYFKLAEVLEGDDGFGHEAIVVHLVLSEAGLAMSDDELKDCFRAVRQEIEAHMGLSGGCMRHFKVWDIFPQAKSGKRDCELMRSDAMGVVLVD